MNNWDTWVILLTYGDNPPDVYGPYHSEREATETMGFYLAGEVGIVVPMFRGSGERREFEKGEGL